MENTQKWDGFGKAPFSWDKLLTDELINIPDMGLEGAVENTARIMYSYIDENAVKDFAEEAINRLGLSERNAQDAYKVLVEYWKASNQGFTEGSSKIIEMRPDKVVYETGHRCQFCRKPVMSLTNIEFYCSLRFKYNSFDNPIHVLLTQAVNPKLKWNLEYFRQTMEEPCRYSITLEQ